MKKEKEHISIDICPSEELLIAHFHKELSEEEAGNIAEVLNILLKYSKAEVKLEQDPKRMRPSDLHTLQGDCSKFMEKTGWKPEYKLEDTLLDLLNYWREKLK